MATTATDPTVSAPVSATSKHEVYPLWFNCQKETIEHLNRELAGTIELEWGERITRGRIVHRDMELVLSSIEPIRPQIMKEIKRIADSLSTLPDWIVERPFGDSEASMTLVNLWLEFFDAQFTNPAFRD